VSGPGAAARSVGLAFVLALAPSGAGADAMVGAFDDFEDTHSWEGNTETQPCVPCPAPPFLCVCPPASEQQGVTTDLGGPDGALDTFLRISALPSHGLEAWNEALDRTGDYASAGIDLVELDAKNFGAGTLSLRVGIERSGTRWVTSDAAAGPLTGSAWTMHSFLLHEAGMTRVAGAESLAFVLADVEQVRLFHAPSAQWTGATGPNLGIDNVLLPEPAALPGLALGAALVAALARRRV
jgi:hypothetical protein